MKSFFLKCIAFLVSLHFCGEVIAQHSASTNSLKESLKTMEGRERIETLHKLVSSEMFYNLDQAEVYANEALALSMEQNIDSLRFESYFHLGGVKILKGEPYLSLGYLEDAYKGFVSIKARKREISTANRLGATYSDIGRFDDALGIYFNALEYGNEEKILSIKIHALGSIGGIYKKLENITTARRYMKEAIKLAQENDSWRNGTLILVELGNLEKLYGDQDSAAFYFQQAIDWLNDKKSFHSIPAILSNIGDIYKDQNRLKEALVIKEEMIKLADSLNSTLFYINGLVELAIIQRMMQDYSASNESLEQALFYIEETNATSASLFNTLNLIAENYLLLGEFSKSIEISTESYELSLQDKSWIRAEQALITLTESYRKMGLYEKAFEAQKKLIDVRDTLINEQRIKTIQDFDAKYNLSQKEQEIAILSLENEKKSMRQNAIISAVAFLLIITVLVIRGQFLKIQRGDARLENEELKRKRLEEELAFKNKQLVTHSLNIVQKKELMMEMRQKVEDIQPKKNLRELKQLTNLIDFSDAIDEDWKEFRLHFEEVHLGFNMLLKETYPDLTPNEMKLSALIKLNLSTKEIAVILGITPDGVKKARYRLRKKLNLTREENLTMFMQEIEKEATNFPELKK